MNTDDYLFKIFSIFIQINKNILKFQLNQS